MLFQKYFEAQTRLSVRSYLNLSSLSLGHTRSKWCNNLHNVELCIPWTYRQYILLFTKLSDIFRLIQALNIFFLILIYISIYLIDILFMFSNPDFLAFFLHVFKPHIVCSSSLNLYFFPHKFIQFVTSSEGKGLRAV